jgi:hypothetical protein
MTMSSGGGGAMYAFLACTASQFMTPTVITVKRQTTIFQLGALFEQHDFNVGTIWLLVKAKVRRNEPSSCARNDRGNCACRSNFTINAGPPTDG